MCRVFRHVHTQAHTHTVLYLCGPSPVSSDCIELIVPCLAYNCVSCLPSFTYVDTHTQFCIFALRLMYFDTRRYLVVSCLPSCTHIDTHYDRKNPPPRGGFIVFFVPWSKTRRKRTPLEEFVPGASRGVLFLRVLDQGTGNHPRGRGFALRLLNFDTRLYLVVSCFPSCIYIDTHTPVLCFCLASSVFSWHHFDVVILIHDCILLNSVFPLLVVSCFSYTCIYPYAIRHRIMSYVWRGWLLLLSLLEKFLQWLRSELSRLPYHLIPHDVMCLYICHMCIYVKCICILYHLTPHHVLCLYICIYICDMYIYVKCIYVPYHLTYVYIYTYKIYIHIYRCHMCIYIQMSYVYIWHLTYIYI